MHALLLPSPPLRSLAARLNAGWATWHGQAAGTCGSEGTLEYCASTEGYRGACRQPRAGCHLATTSRWCLREL